MSTQPSFSGRQKTNTPYNIDEILHFHLCSAPFCHSCLSSPFLSSLLLLLIHKSIPVCRFHLDESSLPRSLAGGMTHQPHQDPEQQGSSLIKALQVHRASSRDYWSFICVKMSVEVNPGCVKRTYFIAVTLGGFPLDS